MPKAPMPKADVERFRNRILDIALDIILKQGFDNLSIRKIASRLGVTATTIYNYYSSKDELNLMIRVRGFEILHDMLKAQYDQSDHIEAQFTGMIRAYVEFGLTYPGYYDLMFNLHTPKYLDYVGTEIEATAHFEKQTALKCLDLFAQPVIGYLGSDNDGDMNIIQYMLIKYWSDLHGLITLYNSRLFHEVTDEADAFVDIRLLEINNDIIRVRQLLDRGESLSAIMPKHKRGDL